MVKCARTFTFAEKKISMKQIIIQCKNLQQNFYDESGGNLIGNSKGKVYFSALLKRYACWSELEKALNDLGIDYGLLEGTNDIWVRDFMPLVSPEGRYITYRYAPDYLRDKPEYITDGVKVMPYSPLIPIHINTVIDGGNIIWCGKKIIFTDKLLKENNTEAIDEFLRAVKTRHITLVPWDKHEPFGHIDGMVRFIDEETVVMTNYCDFDPTFREKVYERLFPEFVVKELHYDVDKPHKYNWSYINFLQAGDKFILPRLNTPEDAQAKWQIAELFNVSESNIRMVDIHTILKRGGGLNCISWNAAPETFVRKFINPQTQSFIAPCVIKSVIESHIGRELEPHFWKAFDEAFENCWNNEIGIGNWIYEGQIAWSVYRQLAEKHFLVDYGYVEKLCNIVFDFISDIPGAILD